MKKLLGGKFILITVVSLILLVGLVAGSYFLFDNDDSKFIKSGYVLNPLSEASEKYFFNQDAGYHKNLSSMIEFNDIDNRDVAVLADSFLHYNDESLSFLKNGAILDVDSINGDDAVKFYNITSSSIIENDNGKYLIKSKKGDININNFIGRINEDKYIFVGDLQLTVNGNTNSIEGKYFEIVYVDDGVVNIENKDVKYQVLAEGSSIRIGSKIVVDLGDKKIMSGDKDVMSITAITIDGNENIEIIPEEIVEEEKPDTNEENGNANGNGNGNDGNGNGGEGEGGTGKDKVDPDAKTEDIIITLKDALIGSTSVSVTFDVMNAKEDDNFTLQVVNLSSGRTIDVVASVVADEKIKINLLTPNTKYLFTVVNEKDKNKYFQKIFETNGFGIKLEKSYATSSSLAYIVTIDDDTDITNATLTLYKYNEETKQNEVVTSKYQDSETGEIKEVSKITHLNTIEGNIGTKEIVYDDLDSDTIYTAVLDEFSIASSNFKDIYNVTVTAMTLKKTPEFNKMNVTQDAGKGLFELSLGDVIDPDSAITKYTYVIYDKLTDAVAINPIEKNNASPISVKIGDGENMLSNDTNYYYKVIIEYYDNEKYIEYITSDSIIFMMGSDPFITVEADASKISYDKIGGTVSLTDNSCLVSIPGREKCDGESSTVLVISKINPLTGELTSVYTKQFEFVLEDGVYSYSFEVDGLEEGTAYNVDVRAILNNDQQSEIVSILHTEDSNRQISTKNLSSFYVSWDTENYASDATHVVNVGTLFNVDTEKSTGALTPEESMNSIRKITVDLYEGNQVSNLAGSLPIKRVSFTSGEYNLKDQFYDNTYVITSDGTFGYDIDALKELTSDGKLNPYYTLVINAYYDNDGNNKVKLSNNIMAYKINKFLLMDDISEPIIEIEKITNKASGYIFENLKNDGTIVGYKLSCAFDRAGMLANSMDPQKIKLYVYDKDKRKVKFYYRDKNDRLLLTDSIEAALEDNNFYEKTIYIGYGTDYYSEDNVMTRGGEYRIGFEIEVLADGKTETYPQVGPGKLNNYKAVTTQKENPNIKMYIARSTADSIKYNYEITDPDRAIYREGEENTYNFYYKIGEGEESKLLLTEKEDEAVKTFKGSMTITGLNNGDKYSLYYKNNIAKTGNIDIDIVPYLDESDSGGRIFDGFYDALAKDEEDNSIYNFRYEIINDQLKNNSVVIKVLAEYEMLERIVNYRVTFKDSKNHTLVKDLWQLSPCDETDEIHRCMSVDYVDLKNAGMKSVGNEENVIRAEVEAFYDNGLTGYEYKVGTAATDDYEYMIMQNNSSLTGQGGYVVFNKAGAVAIWNKELLVTKGFYTYSVNGQRITYKSKYNISNSASIPFSVSSTGYLSSYGILNPKMISIDKMETDSNTFSFNSITPKVATSMRTRLINGAVVNLTLNGIDLADAEKENGKYYVYVETWEDESDVGDMDKRVRPTLKAEINQENPSSAILAVIDGLEDEKVYYYTVYAKMKKNNVTSLVQLFDAGYTDRYETKTYTFKSLAPYELYSNVSVNYTATTDVYGNRELNTKFNLAAYANSQKYNFDLIYALCHIEDGKNCGITSGKTNIFTRTIQSKDVLSGVIDTVDISEYDLEYAKDYKLMVFAKTDGYTYALDNNGHRTFNETKQNIELNDGKNILNLKALTTPKFVITKNAFTYEDGDKTGYGLDFRINLNDASRTIVNGIYHVRLLDESGQVVGTMQLTGDNGAYYTVNNYTEYDFDAWINNRFVRFIGLNPDSKYFLEAYAEAYMNNFSSAEETEEEEYIRKHPVISEPKTAYTVSDLGVAFGRDITYAATERSIVLTFLGGSSFDLVRKVRYTVGLWDSVGSSTTSSGVFNLETTSKKFELFAATDDWKFIIDPPDMKNELGKTYKVVVSFEVGNEVNDETVWLTSDDNPKFEGYAQYVEDNK